jgi:tRNA(fMet)-specific endonuclease VapC
MNGKFLLDTNIVVGMFANDLAICQRLSQRPEVFLSSVVLGELYFGAQKSKRVKENLRRIDELLAEAMVLACDTGTAYEYGIVHNELRLKGRPIPENDTWLAAHARQHGLTLVSRDRHFAEIDELRWEQW